LKIATGDLQKRIQVALEPKNAEIKKISPVSSSGPNLPGSFSKPKDGVKLTFLDEAN
jgi:hypothetical protein